MVMARRYPLLLLMSLGVALSPIYLFESGGLQFAHYAMAVFILLCSVTYRFSPLSRSDLFFLLYVAYVWLRELAALVSGAPLVTMMVPLHLTFVFFLYFYSRRHLYSQSDLVAVGHAISVACSVAFLGVILTGFSLQSGAAPVRAMGTFNNPNQLGYFAVCSGTIVCFLYNLKALRPVQFFLVLMISIFLSLTSLSKASMVSMGFLLLAQSGYLLFSHASREARLVKLLSCLLFVVAVSSIALMFELWRVFMVVDGLPFVDRLVNFASENDSSFTVRGYGIIASASLVELVFGMSSYSAALRHGGHEVHSTLMSQLTYYGLCGSGFLLYFFWRWFRTVLVSHGWLAMCLVCGPVMLFGVTHNGIRFLLFWILISISMSKAAGGSK
ncbi:MAG: hypothetical protein RJQ10_17005 [Haliea sp.]|uniref:hypothetical protein n=1 Tax=Haliea sp. TaxID=1932666 RepID=UPI0032EFB224